MASVVRADIALEPAVMVCLDNVQNTGFPVAVTVTGLGEISVRELLDIPNMGKSNAVSVFAYDGSLVVVRIGI